MGINTKHVGKTDLIQKIQKAENNLQCYATQRIELNPAVRSLVFGEATAYP